ncbi:hypothetical protein [Caproiciproducens sp.]
MDGGYGKAGFGPLLEEAEKDQTLASLLEGGVALGATEGVSGSDFPRASPQALADRRVPQTSADRRVPSFTTL